MKSLRVFPKLSSKFTLTNHSNACCRCHIGNVHYIAERFVSFCEVQSDPQKPNKAMSDKSIPFLQYTPNNIFFDFRLLFHKCLTIRSL